MISEKDLQKELNISNVEYQELKRQLANDPMIAGREEEVLQEIAKNPQAVQELQKTYQLNRPKRKYTRRKNLNPPQYGPENSGKDTPPRTGGGIDPDGIKVRNRETRDRLAIMYRQIGVLLSGFNQADGQIIIYNAEARATELVRVAQHHKELMKSIKAMTEGNDYIACAIGYMSMVIAILANHNKLPENVMTYLANMGRSQNGTADTRDNAA